MESASGVHVSPQPGSPAGDLGHDAAAASLTDEAPPKPPLLALRGLDKAACRHGSSREELVLALADGEVAEEYEAEHGANPRPLQDILGDLIWGR